MNKFQLLFCIFLILNILPGTAQPLASFPEFGAVTVEELKMTDCPFEKGVSAMNIFVGESVDFTVSSYGDVRLEIVTTCKIKIFDKNGYDNATINIPYSGRTRNSRITDIEGSTYNLDDLGNIIKTDISKKEIYREKATEKNDLSTVKFTFPNLKPGSVIEYRYTRIEKDSYFIAPWFFQGEIPTAYSACKIKTPAFAGIETRLVTQNHVYKGSKTNKNFNIRWNTVEKSFSMNNIPAFSVEPFMSSAKDNLQRVEFSLVPESDFFGLGDSKNAKWKQYNSLFLKASFFGQQFEKDIPGTSAFIDSVKKIESIKDRVNAVYTYLKQNLSWDKQYTFYADNITTVWKDKTGNSAELNLILLNLLRSAGIDCYPILFSTRDNGKIDLDFPNVSQFNSVDVLVTDNEEFYVLDAAEKFVSYKIPPLTILNREAFIIDEENSRWITVEDSRMLISDSAFISAILNADGNLTGTAVITYADLSKAEKIKEENKKEETKVKDNVFSEASYLKIDTAYFTDKENALLPLKQTIQFHGELPSTDEFIFLNPFLVSTFEKNPFTDSSRKTDIDFGANSSSILHMEIFLPTEIEVLELNRNKIIRTSDSVLFFSRLNDTTSNVVIVDSRFEIKQAVFDKDSYPAISDFFRNVYGILNQEILLKRKK